MPKKSQISFFLMFGAVAFIIVIFIQYISSNNPKADSLKKAKVESVAETPFLIEPIRLDLDLCVQRSAKEGLRHIGLHGGYYNVAEPKVDYFGEDIPYYAYGGADKVPSANEIERQLSAYVVENLPICFESLGFEGVKIDGKIQSVSTLIGVESVVINVDYPLEVKTADKNTKLSSFRAEIPAGIYKIHNMASNISRDVLESSAICLDCLMDLADYYDVFIDVQIFGDSAVFTIFDNATKLDDYEYMFSFAVD